MAVAIGATVAGRTVGTVLTSPADRQTDAACAAQDMATETLSQGLARREPVHASPLERLLDTPSPLDRFGTSAK